LSAKARHLIARFFLHTRKGAVSGGFLIVVHGMVSEISYSRKWEWERHTQTRELTVTSSKVGRTFVRSDRRQCNQQSILDKGKAMESGGHSEEHFYTYGKRRCVLQYFQLFKTCVSSLSCGSDLKKAKN